MKLAFRFNLIIVALLMALPCFGQTSYRNTFSAKTFNKTTARSDTSTVVVVGAYPHISVQTTTVGTDSAAIAVHVDAMINGLWSNDITANQSVQLGRPAGHTLASTKGQVQDFLLRDAGRTADPLTNCSQIRIRNVLSAGAGDSASATSYTQNVVLSKATW